MKVRYALICGAASVAAAGIMVSCGGGSGGYNGGGGSSGGTAAYSVGGNLSGATGSVTLKLNGGSDMTVTNGAFTFGTMVAYLSTFNVQVVDASDRCTVANGAGTMGVANVTNVSVSCAPQGTEMIVRTAILNGAQAGTTSSAVGVGGVIVDPTTKHITGGITFSGLSAAPTGAHIHRGDTTVAVPLTVGSDSATGIVVDTQLSDADYAELLAGTLYFNVHTPNSVSCPTCSAGEIRGQINLQGGVISGVAAMDGSQESPASTSTATGKGTVIVDRATRNVLIAYLTNDVASPTAAHIHSSQGNPTGPVILGFSFDNAGANTALAYPPAGSQLTAQNITDFLANYLYFNVHSGNNLCGGPCTGGEIRGNVTAIQ